MLAFLLYIDCFKARCCILRNGRVCLVWGGLTKIFVLYIFPFRRYIIIYGRGDRMSTNTDGGKPKGSKSGWLVFLVIAAVLICIFNGDDKPSRRSASGDKPKSTQFILSDPNESDVWETSLPDDTEGGRTYTDSRIPNYAGTDPNYDTLRFEWESQDSRNMLWINLTVDSNMYGYYKKLDRYYEVKDYVKYANDPNNEALAAQIADCLREIGDSLSYSDAEVAREAVNFVQSVIEYKYDIESTGEEDYPKYPIETIYERQGDCEDSSILLAAILKELGYEVALMHLPQHVAVAVKTTDDYNAGSYYELNGHRYLFIESTANGWNIGDIPEKYREESAKFYFL